MNTPQINIKRELKPESSQLSHNNAFETSTYDGSEDFNIYKNHLGSRNQSISPLMSHQSSEAYMGPLIHGLKKAKHHHSSTNRNIKLTINNNAIEKFPTINSINSQSYSTNEKMIVSAPALPLISQTKELQILEQQLKS